MTRRNARQNRPVSTTSKRPPSSHETPSLHSLLDDLAHGKKRNVVFMVGAGISTGAGIPDFRTPGTGLYSNLEELKLPFPEAVFDLDYLRERPEAFYTLAKGLYPSKFKPTPLHDFMAWVDSLGYLKRVYTQNIDCLERLAGVSDERIVEAHGSFAENHCIDCHRKASREAVEELVLGRDDVAIPRCEHCGGIVKPDIVFFGEALPSRFFDCIDEDFNSDVDLVIVAGTSLQVQPFAQLPDMVSKSVTRVLFNMERVGSFGSRPNDVLFLGPFDNVYPIITERLESHNNASSQKVSENESSRQNHEIVRETRHSKHERAAAADRTTGHGERNLITEKEEDSTVESVSTISAQSVSSDNSGSETSEKTYSDDSHGLDENSKEHEEVSKAHESKVGTETDTTNTDQDPEFRTLGRRIKDLNL